MFLKGWKTKKHCLPKEIYLGNKKVPIIVFEWAEQEVKLPTKNVEHDPIFTPDIPLYHSGLQNKMAVQNCLTIY